MIITRAADLADVPAMSRVLTASIIQLCAADHLEAPDAIAAWTANKSEAGVTTMLANPMLQMFAFVWKCLFLFILCDFSLKLSQRLSNSEN